MMTGGTFMLGFGLIAMLLVIGLPVAVIAALVWALTRTGNPSRPATAGASAAGSTQKACSHCDTPLQSGWSHCPQCGAPI